MTQTPKRHQEPTILGWCGTERLQKSDWWLIKMEAIRAQLSLSCYNLQRNLSLSQEISFSSQTGPQFGKARQMGCFSTISPLKGVKRLHKYRLLRVFLQGASVLPQCRFSRARPHQRTNLFPQVSTSAKWFQFKVGKASLIFQLSQNIDQLNDRLACHEYLSENSGEVKQ